MIPYILGICWRPCQIHYRAKSLFSLRSAYDSNILGLAGGPAQITIRQNYYFNIMIGRGRLCPNYY